MNLSTKGRYAVMAMIELAEQGPDAVVPLSLIAANQDISITYLEQIFHKLRKANLVESVRGAMGGYKLSMPAKEITTASIMSSAGETFKTTRCSPESQKGCLSHGSATCKTHDLWATLGTVIYQFLNTVSLQDLLDRDDKIRHDFLQKSDFAVPIQEGRACQ